MLKQATSFLKKQFPALQDIGWQAKAKKWPKGSIVFYTGNRKDGLTPLNLKKGASGTDTAVIYLSREWAKAGREVTVYSRCDDLEGNYEGVNYVNQYYFNPYDEFDILIILAHPYLLPLPIKARKVCWEWQDVLGGEKNYPRAKIQRFDCIFAKSQYQRSLAPEIPDHKFTVVTNGVDAEIAKYQANPKQPYKLIYASRYYRGIDSMLKYGWPIIKQKIPEAELHIYHGWSRKELRSRYDQWRAEVSELFQQEGVFEHGKVSQEYLIQQKSTASIHYYACTYPEIDCISVRESAFVGCVPVTTDFAVFKEKDYCVTVPGEPMTQATQAAVALKIVDLLQNPEELNRLRADFQIAVGKETWQEIAKVWLKTFDS